MISNYLTNNLTNKFLRGFMLGKDAWLITIIYLNKKERFCPGGINSIYLFLKFSFYAYSMLLKVYSKPIKF